MNRNTIQQQLPVNPILRGDCIQVMRYRRAKVDAFNGGSEGAYVG